MNWNYYLSQKAARIKRVVWVSVLWGTMSGACAQSSDHRFLVDPYVLWVTDTSFQVVAETSTFGKAELRLHRLGYDFIKPQLETVASDPSPCQMHYLQASGIRKGESYLYQLISVDERNDTLKGPVTTLAIPDYDRQPVTFAVVGDTQKNKAIWGKVAGRIFEERPSFLLHVGDLVESGHNKNNWVNEFFQPARDLLKQYPLYPVLGNHEGNSRYYYQYFNLPVPPSNGDERFLFAEGQDVMPQVTKGNVLIVLVNTNKDILPGSPQYKKLERILSSSTQLWKVIVHHHPVYVTFQDTGMIRLPHGDDNTMHLAQLYENYGVDVVLNGHMHQYERTEPIYRGGIDREKGVTYLTTGGGGGALDEPAAGKSWFTARTRKLHHFLSFSIWKNSLKAEAIDSSGKVFDSWEVVKKPTISSVVSKARKENLPNGGNFPLMKALPKVANPFVRVGYFEEYFTRLPDFEKAVPLRSFVADSLTLKVIQPRRNDHWAARFQGYFEAPETDVYRLLLRTYDGSRLWIDGKEVIDNDGVHYEIFREKFIKLEKGQHSFEVGYFDFTRRETLQLWMGRQNKDLVDFNTFISK